MNTIIHPHSLHRPGIYFSPFACVCLAIFLGSLLLKSCLPPLRPAVTQPATTPTPFDASTTNGIKITASNARIEAPYLHVDVCYDMPWNADWGIVEATLESDGQQISLIGFGNLCSYWTPCESPGTKCDTLDFPVVKPGMNLTSSIEDFTITISTIAVSSQHGEICTQPFLDQFQRELAIRDERITAKTECDEWREQFLVTGKPSDMTMDEAQSIIWEVYQEIIGIRHGPWILEGRLEK